MLRFGSFFSGVGLLDVGFQQAGIEHAWFCESDPWRREILRKRWPGIPVWPDIRALRAGDLAPVDGVVGGFPCKGVSSAGKQSGFDHTETVLWREMARVVGEVRPRYVVLENVANLLTIKKGLVWQEVLETLASLGFDVIWDCLPAAAVGAPHRRDRVFAVAADADAAYDEGHGGAFGVRAQVAGDHGERVGVAADADGAFSERNAGHRRLTDGRPDVGGGGQAAADSDEREQRERCEPGAGGRAASGGEGEARPHLRADTRGGVGVDWGEYEPAIQRWEAIHGPAPEPLVRRVDDGDPKLRRMRARVDRSRLSALGDGVQVHIGRIVGEYVVWLDQQRRLQQKERVHA